jgi:hypothetical protein
VTSILKNITFQHWSFNFSNEKIIQVKLTSVIENCVPHNKHMDKVQISSTWNHISKEKLLNRPLIINDAL